MSKVNNKYIFFVLFTAVFLACSCGQWEVQYDLSELSEPGKSWPRRVCFNNHCFEVELAVLPEERAKGLMYRQRLDSDRGMLFVYEDEGLYNFWMKNTIIPLDMVWISPDKEVVFIARDVKPCKVEPCPIIYPGRKAKYVLELNANVSTKIGLEIGDRLRFE